MEAKAQSIKCHQVSINYDEREKAIEFVQYCKGYLVQWRDNFTTGGGILSEMWRL